MNYRLTFILFLLPSAAQAQTSDPVTFFETKIRPVLAEHCYECHGPKKQRGDVRVDSRDALTKTTDEGPLIVAGHPEKGRLVKAIRHEGEFKMPPKGKLPAETIGNFTTWIKAGAVWPEDKNKSASASWKDHWAFKPVRKTDPPTVKAANWIKTPVDAFVLAKLEANGLTPNPAADRRTLLRRIKFDLIGLPPTFDEIEAFINDKSPDALEKLIDGYLASPHYGERWGRHWLDVARYADNKGYVFQEERRYAYSYTYRDYVVSAFNNDLPYDRFIHEQLAADRLVATKQAEPPSQAAMGFLTLGRRFLNNAHDIIDDRIDVVTRGLLGLTVQCARCHDHKFDPIPARDYYSLYGVFASSMEPKDLPQIAEPERTPEFVAFEKKVAEIDAEIVKYREEKKKEIAEKNRAAVDGLKKLQKKIEAFKATSPSAPPRAMVLLDGAPMEPVVFLRGNPGNRGPTVPRQFLEVASPGTRVPFKDGSGRLELAQAITSKENPLTARVLVNRIWLHHFGTGLVTTPSDFGVRTDPPSHPKLLDHLAWRFMNEGWSIKKLHKWILLSAVYGQSSAENAKAKMVDPENRLLARAPRQRLDFEATRDSLLAVSGKLDSKVGGRPVEIVGANPSPRRTMYGFIDRQNLPGLFRTFDFASPDATISQRYQTTVPQQALFLLNSPFMLDQAKALMKRPELAELSDPAERIQALHRVLYGRAADDEEIRLGAAFVKDAVTEADRPQLTAWERYGQALMLANEFVFAD